ncbi:MAG: DHH family phosphoesterase [Candidatus Bathyarchaeota archaeon]|jgi:nanoRNase/pAp phosphatase (c-di-AMP/oligoRNAs hydrolase)
MRILDEPDVIFVALLCHHNADPDAICSAYALRSLLKHLKPSLKTQVGTTQGVSRLSKHLVNQLSIEIEAQPDLKDVDIIILLDTNTIQQLNNLAEEVRTSKEPIIVIDHHAPHPETERIAKLYITDEKAASTCEIIYSFYKEAGIQPGENEAKALFLGIAFDTRHFIIANASTLKTVAELIDVGVDVKETLPILSLPKDFSERIARLKAGRRMKLKKINKWIVAFSHVSSYQASAARGMIKMGAHVAAVAGQKDQKLQISLRSTLDFYKKTGIHLGKDIAKPLGEYIKGMGGGHSTAAGVNGTAEIEAGLERCLQLLMDKLTNNQVATLK